MRNRNTGMKDSSLKWREMFEKKGKIVFQNQDDHLVLYFCIFDRPLQNLHRLLVNSS